MTPKQLQRKMDMLKSIFPGIWMRAGSDFDCRHAGAIWVSAESSEFSEREFDEVYGVAAFDHDNGRYELGVHPKVNRVLEELGLWAEFYDAGTVFLYPV